MRAGGEPSLEPVGALRRRVGARWLVELGESSRLWPADEALARLGQAAEVVYEAG